ncbi:ATP-dependent helicase HrpB [Biformimicrobium ophioploci]|nr:ATP-dependent helicase HrpB [Microbulbifer sp. NKW57]
MADKKLPIAAVLPAICEALEQGDELVLEAPPGAGKTTTVPLALLDAPWRDGRKILVLEPRRVAARAAAERMAQLLGESVGETVGYSIRLERKTSRATVIEVVTEGILTRRLQQDPELSDTACVIFDEFHERNIHSDLGLGLCLQSRELFRETPLKLLVMSATLDGASVASLLGDASLLRSEGRSFPVEMVYDRALKPDERLEERLPCLVLRALEENTGDVLVFLPGQREIRAVQSALRDRVDAGTALLPLHGGVPPKEQQQAIAPLPAGGPFQRKVVLATDIAETSLTIEGVNTVVDCGLARKPKFDPRTGMTRLATERISRASATQRAGRAGRLAPGRCYRLWGETLQAQLVPHAEPEILQADLAPLVLQLLQWGVADPAELEWLDTPPASASAQALALLQELGVASGEQLTPHGEQVAALPAHPRLAHMLVIGAQAGFAGEAAQLAAFLGERNPLGGGADIHFALEVIDNTRHCERQHQGWLRRVQAQAKQYAGMLKDIRKLEAATVTQVQSVGFLLASAYPDRIARLREGSRHQYLLANGRAAKLADRDALAGTEWLAVGEIGGIAGQREDRIFAASALDPELFETALAELLHEDEIVAWQQGRMVAEARRHIGRIILSSRPLRNLDQAHKTRALVNYIREQGLQLLPWTDSLRQWRARVALVRATTGDTCWPDLSDAALLRELESWLGPFLGDVKSLADLKRVDLQGALQALLPWPLPQQLGELAPQRLQVPSGSSIAIDYCQSPPVLEVKLQEMFGCRQTPTVVNGKVKLLVHLLSPARRPLQITQDLEGFWNGSYQDVKKDMKGRYPKHPWPDNPWEAQATRFTK